MKINQKIGYLILVLIVSLMLSGIVSYLISKKNNISTDLRLILNGNKSVILGKNLNFISDNFNNKYINININGYVGNINIYFKNMIDEEFGLRIYNGDNNGNINLKGSIAIPQNRFYAKFTVDKPFSNLILQMSNADFYKNINQITINESIFNKYFFIRFFLIFILMFFAFMHFIFNIKNMYEKIYEYKYYIGFAVVVFAIVCELSGSSIAMWQYSTDYYESQNGLIAGKPRSIRSDEWNVYTPIQLSQTVSGYKYFNNISRGSETDMFLFYAQPVKNTMSVFRPFLCGFLVLNPAKGLSFFWTGRLVSLFLISFMFFMMLTKSNKKISLLGAVMITFAPVVQWCFTSNGIVEILIFGELAVLMFYQYLKSNNFLKRVLFLFIMYVCLGGYILVLYPAWQVPFAYVFFAICLWLFLENRKKCQINFKDFISILFFILLFSISMFYIYNKSFDAIYSMVNSLYPGKRFETGGTMTYDLFRSWGNIFFPIKDNLPISNVCDMATFFDLFPMGLILTLWVIFKEKVKDVLLIILLIFSFFIIFWCVVGFPEFLARISLMYLSPLHKTLSFFGFLNVILLIRALSLVSTSMNLKNSLIISSIITSIITVSSGYIYGEYMTVFMIFIIIILSFLLFLSMLQKKLNKIFMFVAVSVVLFGGLFVNPVQSGIDIVNKTELAKVIKKINDSKHGLWIVEGNGMPPANYLIMQGASTINSTNSYPNIDLWKKLDKDEKYKDIYNRYCHINVMFTQDLNMEKFKLIATNAIQVNLTVNDLITLHIDYIFTRNDLPKYNSKNIKFLEIYSDGYYKIYKLDKV
ncbi:MAG: hypothetical protein PHR82_07410 [Endomicrobiaceae bacterium]|nr:hypothetical protein [Endomicrobiaceae bacterium]